MVNYRKIPGMEFDGISQRTISSSTGHSRNTIAEVVQRAKERGLKDLEDDMCNRQLYFAIGKCRVLQRFLQSVAAKDFQLVRESALVKR